MTTYEKIKQLCDSNGVTIHSLEKDLGLSHGSIYKMRDTIKNPAFDKIAKIANYFNVDSSYFLDETPQNKEYYFSDESAKIAQEIQQDPNLRMLFDASRDVEPENIKLAAEMLTRFKTYANKLNGE